MILWCCLCCYPYFAVKSRSFLGCAEPLRIRCRKASLPSAPVIDFSGRDPRRVGFPLDLHTLPEHGKISYCGIRPGDTNSRCGVLYFGVLIVFSCGGCRCHPCTHRSTSSCSSRRPLMLRCSLVVWLFLPSVISHSPRQSHPALW